MSTKLVEIANKARKDKKAIFTSLAYVITPEFLKETWEMMNRKGAGGVDGETIKEFEKKSRRENTGRMAKNEGPEVQGTTSETCRDRQRKWED